MPRIIMKKVAKGAIAIVNENAPFAVFEYSGGEMLDNNEIIYGHSYSRIVTENEDGTITLDRTFTESHPYDSYI